MRLRVDDLDDGTDPSRLQRSLVDIDGVRRARVDVARGRIEVVGRFDDAAVWRTLETLGYRLGAVEGPSAGRGEPAPEARFDQVVVFGVTTAVVTALTILPVVPPPWLPGGRLPWGWVFALTSAALLWGARSVWAGAWRSVRRRCIGIELLLATTTVAAWLHTLMLLISPGSLPMESRGLFLAFPPLALALFIWARWTETLVWRSPERRAIRSLRALRPHRVTIVDAGDGEREAPLEEVAVGQRLRVRAGERVPVDGRVVSGRAALDESLLTGEGTPVERRSGEPVVGGTLNRGGAFTVEATRTQDDSTLANMIESVRRARDGKPAAQPVLDLVAARVLPAVAVTAAVSAGVWVGVGDAQGHALAAALGTLILAFPPLLAVAAALPLSLGVTRAVEYGAVTRRGEALRAAERITVIVLDKTGTVTRGSPEVVAVEPCEGMLVRELFRYAASLEGIDAGARAAALVQAVEDRGIELAPVLDRRSVPGGVMGRVGEHSVIIGDGSCMIDRGVRNPLALRGEELQDDGCQPLFVAVDGEMAGLLALADAPRPEASTALQRMAAMGLQVVMLTGDEQRTAEAVAREVGIDRVFAGVLPNDKAACIRMLQARGERVAMVGNGINDAAALVQADVGFAVAGATDVARQSADITLSRDSLHAVADALAVARAVGRNVRQNIYAAILYNTVAIFVATGVFVPAFGWMLQPTLLVTTVVLATLTVGANSHRLRFFEVA